MPNDSLTKTKKRGPAEPVKAPRPGRRHGASVTGNEYAFFAGDAPGGGHHLKIIDVDGLGPVLVYVEPKGEKR